MSLACCSPWGCKELEMTYQLNNNNKPKQQASKLYFKVVRILPFRIILLFNLKSLNKIKWRTDSTLCFSFWTQRIYQPQVDFIELKTASSYRNKLGVRSTSYKCHFLCLNFPHCLWKLKFLSVIHLALFQWNTKLL